MKIKELVELANSNKNRLLKTAQLSEVIKKAIEVKDYIGIKQKKELINDIINDCVLYEDGIYKFDDIERYICFTMKTISAYTNLELSDDIEEDYDALCSSKLLNVVIDAFAGEYDNLHLLFQMQCDYVLRNNNMEAQLGKFLNDLLEKIGDIADVASDKISKFDISKLPFSKEDLKKLMNFINIQK